MQAKILKNYLSVSGVGIKDKQISFHLGNFLSLHCPATLSCQSGRNPVTKE